MPGQRLSEGSVEVATHRKRKLMGEALWQVREASVLFGLSEFFSFF
jgi:hypothetical protein